MKAEREYDGCCLLGNHNAGISERDRRITYMDALVKQRQKWGGYVINCDMNDAPKDTGGSDHGGTLEYFLNNETLYQTLKKYSRNYILLAKTTSAWSNVSYNSHESVALGAWLDVVCSAVTGQNLIDSWMWFIEGYGPQWGANTFSVQGGPEECRRPGQYAGIAVCHAYGAAGAHRRNSIYL